MKPLTRSSGWPRGTYVVWKLSWSDSILSSHVRTVFFVHLYLLMDSTTEMIFLTDFPIFSQFTHIHTLLHVP